MFSRSIRPGMLHSGHYGPDTLSLSTAGQKSFFNTILLIVNILKRKKSTRPAPSPDEGDEAEPGSDAELTVTGETCGKKTLFIQESCDNPHDNKECRDEVRE
jgi:hypothetical protein